MTKQEICRAISEKLEPEPNMHERRWTVGEADSLKFWKWHSLLQPFIPLDYFTSEDASAKLLEAMPLPTIRKSSLRGHQWWRCDPDIAGEYSPAIHIDRKTAIVIAAMRWLGIEGEISE